MCQLSHLATVVFLHNPYLCKNKNNKKIRIIYLNHEENLGEITTYLTTLCFLPHLFLVCNEQLFIV